MALTVSVTVPIIAIVSGGFGMEVGFEYAITPSASARLSARYMGFRGDGEMLSMFRIALEGRWYPQGNALQGWFVSGSAQMDAISPFGDNDFEGSRISVFAGGGYKAVFEGSQSPAFFVEPRLDFGLPLNLLVSGDFSWWLAYLLLGMGGPRFSVPIGVTF